MRMNAVRKGVVAVIYRDGGDEPEFLLMHRKLHWKGWELPKGGINEGETEEAALAREIEEETGLRVDIVGKVPVTISYDYSENFQKQFKTRGAEQSVYLARYKPGEIFLSDEHDDFRWATFQEALQLLRYDGQKQALERAFEMLGKNA